MSEQIEIPNLEALDNYKTLNALRELVKTIHAALVTAKNTLDRKVEDNKNLAEELERTKKAVNEGLVDRTSLMNKFEQGKRMYEDLKTEINKKQVEHQREIKELEDKVILQEERLEEKKKQMDEDKKKMQEMSETIKHIDEKIEKCESLENEKFRR